ncbi:hypothetical protein GQ600_18541 [Phytophthora cactorum]|nr:hypothetical protein GQ600_18541 [Phytophthora cactorum]
MKKTLRPHYYLCVISMRLYRMYLNKGRQRRPDALPTGIVWLGKIIFRDGEDARRRNLACAFPPYTDSIVSTDLTLPVDDYECVICGCSFRFLEVLPIPAEAMTSGFYKCSVGERNKLNEPLLARCENCKTP